MKGVFVSPTRLLAVSVVDRVESFEVGLAEDEVQPSSGVNANVLNNQVNATGNTTNSSVEATTPDLSVSG